MTLGAPFIDDDSQLVGFRPVAMNPDEFSAWVSRAREAGAIAQGADRILARLEHPLVLEADADRAVCEVRRVRIPFGGRLPAVVVVDARPGVAAPDPLVIDAMLLDAEGTLAGGSTFHVHGLG